MRIAIATCAGATMTKPEFKQYSFPYDANVILVFENGSAAHGARLEGKSDTDFGGVFIEPPEKIIGIDSFEHFVHTTGSQAGQNGPDDLDVCLYSLRKWAVLAAKGNPASLYHIFAPALYKHILWESIVIKREVFLSRGHVRPFLGFADDQMKRLMGERGQKNVNRTELEEKFGYDTKYAMHIIRLYGEARELMETGKISLPRPNVAELIDIRQGKYTLEQIRSWGRQLESEALAASDKSPLPARINRDKVSEVIAYIYRQFWNW